MMRTRLVFFTLGLGSAAALMSQFVFKDLWVDRQNLSSDIKQQFDALDARVSNLEQVLPSTSNPQQE